MMTYGVLDSNSLKTLKDEVRVESRHVSTHFELTTPPGGEYKGIESPTFGNGHWKLAVVERREGDSGKGRTGEVEVRLVAVFNIEDTHGANSKTAWIRAGRWSVKLDVTLSSQAEPISLSSKAHEYSSKAPARGKVLCDRLSDLFDRLKQDNKIVISCVVTGQGVDQPPLQRPFNAIGSLYFDQPQYADVVLMFPDHRRIFASQTVLEQASSHFKARGPKMTSINIAARENYVFDSQAVIEDDMGVFPLARDPASRELKRRRTSVSHAQLVVLTNHAEFRSMLEVKIDNACFNTVRALIAYLYTGLLPFTALPSDYLVALHLSNAAGATSQFPLSSQWLQSQFEQLPEQPTWTGIAPCSPHALYRLASQYAIDEVKKIALGRIVRSLTVENVSYELFSPLSLEFQAVQDAVFAYFASHWAKVRTTPGWHKVHDKIVTGQLEAASTLIKRVWDVVPLDADRS
ncbi:hypothetical protein JCM11491_004319 [Sporobolomyces phaffii]